MTSMYSPSEQQQAAHSSEDLVEENSMLRENIKALQSLFKKEEAKNRILEVDWLAHVLCETE